MDELGCPKKKGLDVSLFSSSPLVLLLSLLLLKKEKVGLDEDEIEIGFSLLAAVWIPEKSDVGSGADPTVEEPKAPPKNEDVGFKLFSSRRWWMLLLPPSSDSASTF